MPRYRKAVFIVVYKKEREKLKYLLLKRKLHWKGWEFPKGGVEKGESLCIAVEREAKEETGCKAKRIINFNKKGKYKYQKKLKDRQGFIGQTYKLFAVQVDKNCKNINIDKKEHSIFRWLDFNKARKLLKWQNQKDCLVIVDKWLNRGKLK